MLKFDKNFDASKWTIKSTGEISRDWIDLLKSENAQHQVDEAIKLYKNKKLDKK